MEYERVRFDGKTVYLYQTEEAVYLGQKVLKGNQVDKAGDLVTDRNGAFVDQVIALQLITKRTEVFYDNKYGVLE